MNIKLKLLIGFIFVLFSGSLTIVANYPKYYSPYSFTIVIPTFMLYSTGVSGAPLAILAALPNSLLFWFNTGDIRKGECKIGGGTLGIAAVLALLSISFLMAGFSYGVKYQGLSHTLLMYLFNALFLTSLIVVVLINRRKPTINNSLLFRCLLFSWLGWCSFPWLGELI